MGEHRKYSSSLAPKTINDFIFVRFSRKDTLRKILSILSLLSLLFLSLPVVAQDDTSGSISSEIEAEIEPSQTKIYLPTVIDMGAITPEVPDLVTAAAASFGAFNPRLIPIEIQSWWMPAYGHVHTGAMLPFAKEVSGVLSLPVRIVMHDNPGKLHRFDIWDGRPKLLTVQMMGDQTCNQSVCAWGLTAKLDTRLMLDGCQELRIKSYINTPDGKQMITSSGVPVMVKNGSGAGSDFNKSCTTGQFIGRGWYTGINYINAIFESVPTAPVKGTITVGFRAQGEASSRLLVELDKSHYIPAVGAWPEALDTPGTILFDQAGNLTKFQHIKIDTTKLSNGWHSLSAKSTSAKTAKTNGIDQHEVGVAKYWFYVSN